MSETQTEIKPKTPEYKVPDRPWNNLPSSIGADLQTMIKDKRFDKKRQEQIAKNH